MPLSAIGLLLGKTVDLVTWQVPSFSLNLANVTQDLFDAQYGPFYLEVDLLASLDVDFFGSQSNPLTLGLDTSGIASGQFFNGFYMSDTPLVTFNATLGIGASIGVGLGGVLGVSAGLAGEVGANVSAGLGDPSNSPKIYFNELQSNCAVQLSGSLYGQVQFYITEHYIIGSSTQTITIVPPQTFLSFATSCPIPILAHFEGADPNDPNEPAGTLILNVGPYSGDRIPGTPDGDDNVTVTQLAPGEVQVTGFGETEDYGSGVNGEPAVTGIYADAGGGASNTILLTQSGPGAVTEPATLKGAGGEDDLQGGIGNNVITGAGGNDVLESGDGNDVITYSGGGSAYIIDGNGDDRVNAVNGNVYVKVGNGQDTINGGTGNDTIYTGTGNDSIVGGSGSGLNEIFGGGGNNTIIAAGSGTYVIYGGAGNNYIQGAAGTSVIYGNAPDPNDTAGDGTNPYNPPAGGNDTIYGGSGNDAIYGGGGRNTIHGGSGNDTIYGGPNGDMLYGDSGNDLIVGGDGNDTIHGGSGDSTLFGNGGNDILYADTGTDLLYGGAGNDTLYGGIGNSSLYGNSGDDVLYGGTGNQYLEGDDGNDFLHGGTGNQTLVGGSGDDYFQTGLGTEQIYGGTGNNLLVQYADADQVLTNSTLTGLGNVTYSDIQRISLYGGADPHTFDVGAYTGVATLTSTNGDDVVASTDDADFTLAAGHLSRSDGASFDLVGVTRADLTGTGFDTFDITGWSGTATLNGGGGHDLLDSFSDGDQTLTDTSLVRADGGTFTLSNITQADLTAGPSSIVLDTSGFSGQASLFGGAGNDTLLGGSGDDYIVGGAGHDYLSAGSGNTILVGTAGSGDTLIGGPGQDTIYGSQGADSISGGTGSDVIYSGPVASLISGGTGPDTIVGGASGDTIYGNGGADVLIAGGGHELIYADNAAGTGDTGAVSYLYGTYAGEPGAGTDTLIGGKGNDELFGYGDTIVAGTAGSIVDNSLATDPVPAAPPVAAPSQGPLAAPGTTPTPPTGPTDQGRWTEFAGSASGGGLSNSPGLAVDPSIAAGPDGEYVAWADSRSGIDQIDVSELTAAGWQSLGSLPLGGAIVATAGTSLSPSIAVAANGEPIVAWTVQEGLSSDILVAQYDPEANGGAGGWDALGDSLAPGGISGTGAAGDAQVVDTSAGPVVAYVDRSSGAANVYVKEYNGSQWVPLGPGSASGAGVSGSTTDVQGLTIATDGARVAVAWTQTVGNTTQVYLTEYAGGTWSQLGGSASNNGLSDSSGQAVAPTLAFDGGSLFAAWSDNSSGAFEIYAATWNGNAWAAAGPGADSGGGVSDTGGMASDPKLAAGGGQLDLLWLDNRLLNSTGNTIAPYVKQWDGSAFVEAVVGDASYRGIGDAIGDPASPALAVGPGGEPFAAWVDTSSGSAQIYVRGNTFVPAASQPFHYVNGPATDGDSFSTAPGAASNDGLTPATPKDSVQDVAGQLAPGDILYLDAGSYGGFTLGSAGDGVFVLGSLNAPTTILDPVAIDGSSGLTLEDITFEGAVILTDCSDVTLEDDTFEAGIKIAGGSGVQIVHDLITAPASGTGVALTDDQAGDGTTGADIEYDAIGGGAQGIAIIGAGVTELVVRFDDLSGSATGIDLANPVAGQVAGDTVAAVDTALLLGAAFTGSIVDDDFRGAAVGVSYQAGADFTANRIHGNTIGIVSTVADPSDALGFGVDLGPNQIYEDTTGVELVNATMQDEHVYDNQTGVDGSGALVASDLDHANVIEENIVGVNFTGPIEFNRIDWNSIGIEAQSNQLIAHNDIYRNTETAVEINGQTNVSIVNNTLFSSTGDLIRIEGGASDVEVLNNVLWTEGGFDLYIADDSQSGFFSDYNDLFSSGTGQLVSWDGLAFNDILDWQDDVYEFDLDSIGRTVVNPLWAEPRFVGLSVNDFDVFDQLAGLRFTSPTIDAGDPITDEALPSYYNNLLTNPGFESGLTGWTATPGSTTQSGTPAAWQGGSYFDAGNNAVATVEQTVDLTASGFTAQEIDTQNLNVIFGGRVRSGTANPSAAGTIEVTFYDSSGDLRR